MVVAVIEVVDKRDKTQGCGGTSLAFVVVELWVEDMTQLVTGALVEMTDSAGVEVMDNNIELHVVVESFVELYADPVVAVWV